MQCRPDVERLCHHLRHRLEAYGIEARTASRLQTVQATLALVSSLAAADKDEIVTVLAQADIATSDTAMGETVKKAADVAHALVDRNTPGSCSKSCACCPQNVCHRRKPLWKRSKSC